jgi:radical SAM protein with 4Fe4S-binding SPASM domain
MDLKKNMGNNFNYFNKNSDIQNVKFLNSDSSLTIISKEYLMNILKVSNKNYDQDCFNFLIKNIENEKNHFKINLQEQNYISKISDDKILSYLVYRYQFKYYPRLKKETKFPIYILIEPVSSCNLKCPMCFQSDKSFIKKEFMGKMSFDLYKKVIDECEKKGTQAITFGSRGEPTIHNQITEFLSYASNKFMDIKLITNATKLDEKLINSIFENNIQQVVFSIDSENKETYERIRKFGNYEQVLSNVKKYNEIKKRYKDNKTITRISGIKVEESQSEEKFYDFWKEYADEIVFKKAYSRWDTYNNETHDEFLEPCHFIWERAYIWYDGKVNPCDADYKSMLSYGNVNENSIEEIWNSEKLKKLKNTHLKNNRNQCTPCDRCGIS